MTRASAVFGLYVPGASVIHRTPASVKLGALLVLGLAATIPPPRWWLLGPLGALTVLLFLLAGLGWRRLGRQLRMLLWLVLFVLASQLIFLLPPATAVANTSRMLIVILLAAVVTLTTRTSDMLAALEAGLRPFRRIGINPERVSLVLAMTVRTVPILADIAGGLRDAQRARSGRFSLIAFVVPLLVASLRQADELADALAARGLDD